MKKQFFAFIVAGLLMSSCGARTEASASPESVGSDTAEVSTVYYIKDITRKILLKSTMLSDVKQKVRLP